eukprot:m.212331 g.212331  ORF g.212331 m.212331 type:complete len:276 (-) comp15851_c0_seq2:1310-2137(-)
MSIPELEALFTTLENEGKISADQLLKFCEGAGLQADLYFEDILDDGGDVTREDIISAIIASGAVPAPRRSSVLQRQSLYDLSRELRTSTIDSLSLNSNRAEADAKEEMKFLFEEADKDNNNTLERAEFVSLLTEWSSDLRGQATREYASEIFDELDSNKDGRLDFEEFCKGFESVINNSGALKELMDLSELPGIQGAQFRVVKTKIEDLELENGRLRLAREKEIRSLRKLCQELEETLDQTVAESDERLAMATLREKALQKQIDNLKRELEENKK